VITHELVTFSLEDALLGVEVGAVQEVLGGVQLTGIPLAPSAVAGLVNLRGQVLLAVDLRARMGRPARKAGDPKASVILLTERGQVCLVVDSIGEVVRVSDDQFEPPPETLTAAAHDLVRGAYKLDRQLLLALDIESALHIDRAATEKHQFDQGDPS
jgi:purine-binding chemotaxis protein CheW